MEPKLVCYRCGCEKSIHTHYRVGEDCGHCGRVKCWAYKAPPNPHLDSIVFCVSLGMLLIGCLIVYSYLT